MREEKATHNSSSPFLEPFQRAFRTENLRIAPVWMNSSAWILLVSTIIMREDVGVRLFKGADVDGDRFFTNRHHCI
jgi:hypothetical protein